MNKIKSFIFISFVLMALLFSGFSVSAMTEQEIRDQINYLENQIIEILKAQIAQLQAQIAEILTQQQGTTPPASTPTTPTTTPSDSWCHNFNTNIRYYATGPEVSALHTALEKQGFTISASELSSATYLDSTTYAVNTFQERYASEILRPHGLTRGTGFAGPSTRAKLNQLYGCQTTTPTACAQDVRQCPDGSWVSRVPPDCNFAPCPTEEVPCIQQWQCSQWSACINGQRTRTCVDLNNCVVGPGMADQKVERESCVSQDWCHNFTRDIRYGTSGSDVRALHTALQGEGFSISFLEVSSSYFGDSTVFALNTFQERYASEILRPHGLTRGTGFAGPSTRAKLNQLYGCQTTTPTACAQDVRQCPDGSWVSRVPPDCNFAPCPTETTPQCTENNWIPTLSPTTCPSSGQQTRTWTKIGNCQGGVAKPAFEVVPCNYQAPTCNFYYTNWSECLPSGIQYRTITDSYPAGCQGGDPETSKTCTYTPPTCMPDWQCSTWSTCVNGQQTRNCTDYNYCGTTENRPVLSQSCTASLPAVDLKVNNSDGPVTISYNSSVAIVWSSENVSSCIASGDWSGNKSITGSESRSNLTSTKNYTITCTGPGGTTTDTVCVNVSQPLPVVDIKANNSDGPLIVASDSSVLLSWSSQNATSCTASGGWSGIKNVSGSESSIRITSSQTFTITCTGPGGTASDSVIVAPTAEVMASIKANNTSSLLIVDNYTSVVLSWSSQNATSCTASGNWTGTKHTTGQETIQRYQNPTDSVWERVYTITCTGSNGTASDTVRVNVSPYPRTPTVDIRFNNSNNPAPFTRVESGTNSNRQFTLSWSSTNSTSCIASGYGPSFALSSWNGSKELIGYQNMSIFFSTSSNDPYHYIDYTITCTGPGGNATDTVRVYYFRTISAYAQVEPLYYGGTYMRTDYKISWITYGTHRMKLYFVDREGNKIKHIHSTYDGYSRSFNFSLEDWVFSNYNIPAGYYKIGFYSNPYYTENIFSEIFLGETNTFYYGPPLNHPWEY